MHSTIHTTFCYWKVGMCIKIRTLDRKKHCKTITYLSKITCDASDKNILRSQRTLFLN